MHAPDWVALLNAIHDWAYPHAGSSTIPEESLRLMRSITAGILTGLSEVSRPRPGVQQRLREYAEQLGIEPNTERDSEFDILFPIEDLENWEATSKTQAREVKALAVAWHGRGPQQVGGQRLHLESEAALAGKSNPRLTWLFCETLANVQTRV